MRVMLLATTLCLAISPLLAQKTASFQFKTYNTEGSSAVSAALADFDRDGYPDMAVLTDVSVDVFFNDHKGGFGAYTSYPVSSNSAVIAVDLNGDGWPDLLISGGNNTALINNGDGTFHLGTPPTTKAGATSFVAGDFNNDGKVDLAAVEANGIEILLNNGDGTFTSGQFLAGGGIAVADFDGDGNLDIINSSNNNAVIWWGNGKGTFPTTTQIPAPTSDGFSTFAAADFNNDGRMDFAASSSHYNGCTNPENVCGDTRAHIYKNEGARVFKIISSYTVGVDLGETLYAADITGDLNYDIISLYSAAGVQSGDISDRPGNGNETFGANQDIDGDSAFELDFRDLDLDSRTDMVAPVYFPSPFVIVAKQTGGYKTCPGVTSASLHAKICAPANNANVSTSVLVTAGGNSPIGVTRLEVWIDGKKVYQKLGDQMNKKFTLTTGRHRLVVVAVDKQVGTSSTVEYVNVQ
ncbi:MAG TPA: VCBS repeat-containing protein [Candidatus Koribacter sp.]|jgi:hypothetical protein